MPNAPRLVKIHGERGRWVADVEGKQLAVIHHTLRVPPNRYVAPILAEHVGSKRLAEFERALRENCLVIIQRDKDAVSLARDGYVGVFHFTDLKFDENSEMSLTLTDRYASPK